MLEIFKSSYFFGEKLFSYIDIKRKLKIIKYNKYLQNILFIKLINYKFLSGKYIIYETNGKGKEYDGEDDSLKFEGEYLNGRKNGIGKEYFYKGKLKFEGEYLNGKKNSESKEYYYDRKIKFEGEYFNGLEWNGKGYDKNNNIVYELNNGKGYVKEYYDNGKLIFEGAYLNGLKNGKGKEYFNDELLFDGEYLNEKKKG